MRTDDRTCDGLMTVAARRIAALLACALTAAASAALAQDMEPRSYANAPVGMDFLIAGYAFTRGGLSFDPSVPVTHARLSASNAVLAYARVLELWGNSGNFGVILPYTWLSGSADYHGASLERNVNGFGDPAFRLSVNFYGAPAVSVPEFKSYEQGSVDPHRQQ
jgi:hypothetical protein